VPNEPNVGPTLRETFDWLKEKIPLATIQYAAFHMVNGTQYTESASWVGTVTSFDSCTVVFGDVEVTTTKEFPQEPPFTITDRYTLPLGALTEVAVYYAENNAYPSYQFISGERWGYHLVLKSKSTDILYVTSTSRQELAPTTKSTRGLVLFFDNESLAQRVAQAFRHASDLCRKGEVF
jgi:hypothetical protein